MRLRRFVLFAAAMLMMASVTQSLGDEKHLASPNQDVLPTGWWAYGTKIVELPESYSEEKRDISFCYAFAAAELLNHMLASTKGDAYEPVSLVEAATYGRGADFKTLDGKSEPKSTPYFWPLGHEVQVLRYFSLTRSISTESSAPFARLKIMQSSNPNADNDTREFYSILIDAFGSPEAPKKPDYGTVADDILKWEPNLLTRRDQIVDVLKANSIPTKTYYYKILGSIVVPNHLRGVIELPPFKAKTGKLTVEKQAAFKAHVIEMIGRDRPLIWGFCISDDCQTQHVLVVFGHRVICSTRGKCTHQFRMRDSGVQIAEEPGDYWVDQEAIDGKNDVMFKAVASGKAPKIVPNRVTYLEF